MTLIVAGPNSRSKILSSTDVAYAQVVASSSLVSAIVTIHSSSFQSAPVPMLSAIVAVSSVVPFGQPSLSAVGLRPFQNYGPMAIFSGKLFRGQ